MKKLALKSVLVALSTFFAVNSTAMSGRYRSRIMNMLKFDQAHVAEKEVVEFFSFYCPHCYDFELTYKIPSQIKNKHYRKMQN